MRFVGKIAKGSELKNRPGHKPWIKRIKKRGGRTQLTGTARTKIILRLIVTVFVWRQLQRGAKFCSHPKTSPNFVLPRPVRFVDHCVDDRRSAPHEIRRPDDIRLKAVNAK